MQLNVNEEDNGIIVSDNLFGSFKIPHVLSQTAERNRRKRGDIHNSVLFLDALGRESVVCTHCFEDRK